MALQVIIVTASCCHVFSYLCRLLPFVAICCLLFEFIALYCHFCHFLPFAAIECYLLPLLYLFKFFLFLPYISIPCFNWCHVLKVDGNNYIYNLVQVSKCLFLINNQWPNLKNLSGGLNLSRGLNMVGST